MALSFGFLLLFSLQAISAAQFTTAAQNGDSAAVQLWCVAKNNAEDSSLQSALDWACGPGGADCSPILEGGPCYDPSAITRTASYAFNDYFLKHGMTPDSCNFANTAALTSINPSYNNCKFQSSTALNNGNFSGSSTIGLGPASADTSSSGYIGGRWVQALMTIPLVFAMI